MDHAILDYLIVIAFVLITLIMGLRAGWNVKDMREYAIANKTFGTGALVLTLLATYIAGACVMNDSACVFSDGIIMTIALLSVSISLLIFALLVAPKFALFGDCITMGDLMHRFYGTQSGILAGVLGLLNAIFLSGMELVVLGIICETLLGIRASWGTAVGGFTLAAYVAHGGIKSVTITDVLQFMVLAIFIPLIAYVAVSEVGSIEAVFTKVPAERLAVFSHPNFSFYLTLFLMWIIPAGMIDPALIQRLLMAKHGRQLRNQYLVAAAFDPTFRLVVMLIGLAGLALYPHIEAEKVVPTIIHKLLPVGIKGMAMAGVLAVCMSTIDSYIHAAGLTLVHDIVRPICVQRGTPIDELRWVRYATVMVGIAAIAIGLYATDILGLAFSALEFTGPLLMFPLLSGVMGLKTDKTSFYTAFWSTLVAFGLAKWLLPSTLSHFTILISTVVNGLAFFGTHIVQNKGLAIVNREQGVTLWQPAKVDFWVVLQQSIPTPMRIVRYSQTRVARYGAPYVLFGVFCCINYILPYFMWPYHVAPWAKDTMLWMRLIGAVSCVLLIFREKWPEYLLPYFPTFWHLTILYCLPFTSTVMFLLTQGSVEWLINVMGVILFLIVLVDWVTFIILSVLGIALGFLFYRLALGPISLQLDFSTGYLLVYQCLFGTIIGLLFARRKQRHADELANENEVLTAAEEALQAKFLETYREKIRLIQSLGHAGAQNLLKVVEMLKQMREKLRNANAAAAAGIAQKLEKKLIPTALQLRGLGGKASNYLRLEVAQCTLQDLFEAVRAALALKGIQNIQLQLNTQHTSLMCDAKRLQTMLVNAVTAMHATTEESQMLLIGVEDTTLHYPLPAVKPDYVKKIAALRLTVTACDALPELQAAYQVQLDGAATNELPSTAQAVNLLENERIVKAHYGCSSQDEETLYYVVPIALRAVRSKDLDKDFMELGAAPRRADDSAPESIKQERAFFRVASKRLGPDTNIDTLERVLELIKWYHGPTQRQSGGPFYLHPLAVARIVLDFDQVDETTVIAALLHDTVEDTGLLLEEIEAVFGKDTADVVSDVTGSGGSSENGFYKVKLSDEELLMQLETSGNDRAMRVKLADRLHNMRTIESMSTESQLCKAEETLEFYVPQAKRLKLNAVAKDLKRLSEQVFAQHALEQK